MKAALGDGTVALLLKELEASLLSTSFTKRLSDHSLTRPFDVLVEESETTGQSSGTPSPDAYLALNFIYVSLLTGESTGNGRISRNTFCYFCLRVFCLAGDIEISRFAALI